MKLLLSTLKSLPVQLVLSILAAFLLGSQLDHGIVTLFYTASSCFIDLLLFILPFMVFSLIYLAISSSKQKSLQLLLLILVGVFVSNIAALFVAYYTSLWSLDFIGISGISELFSSAKASITPLFRTDFPTLLSSDKAMLLAVTLGLIAGNLRDTSRIKNKMQSAVSSLQRLINFLLNKFFIPLLPLYVFGFCLKLSYEESLQQLFSSYGKVFILSMLLVASYILLLYFLGAGMNFRQMLRHLRTMSPAGLTGFSTMSSAATMPVTIKCTDETTGDAGFTRLVIPTTANIHMLGDDLTIVMTAMTLLAMFGMPAPDLMHFAIFASAFSVAKLSCVGVPGASVLVILPVLQNYLQFSPEMITVLTTIYILQDSFGTAANVMGNGAFALILQRLTNRRPARLEPSTPNQKF